jgi:hypothetical protein
MRYADALILEARPVTEEVLPATQYATLSDADRARIKEAKIVAPKLGEKGFGGIQVRYKNVIYKAG